MVETGVLRSFIFIRNPIPELWLGKINTIRVVPDTNLQDIRPIILPDTGYPAGRITGTTLNTIHNFKKNGMSSTLFTYKYNVIIKFNNM